jgi:hypothetical protein
MYDVHSPPLAALALVELAAPSVAAQIKSVGKEKHSTTLSVTQTREYALGGHALFSTQPREESVRVM